MKHYIAKGDGWTFNIEEFNSAYEVVEVNNKREVTSKWEGNELTESEVESDTDFYGVQTMSEAYDLLKNGWTQEVERMNAILRKAHTVYTIDAQAVALALGNSKVLNSVVLGYSADLIGFDKETWLSVVETTVPPKTVELNKKAFICGYEAKK